MLLAASTPVYASTIYPGALIEGSLAGGGFVATYTPQPNLAAAQLNGYGWVSYGVSATSASDAWAVGAYVDRVGTEHAATEHFSSSWQNVSNSAAPPKSRLSGVVAVSANDVWAVGQRAATVSGQQRNRTLIEHWNGISWSVVPSQDAVSASGADGLTAVAAAGANNVWAAGEACEFGIVETCSTLFEHWNGIQWTVVPSSHAVPLGPTNGHLCDDSTRCPYSVALAVLSDTDVWAVYGGSTSFVMHWDGTSWTAVSGAIPSGHEINGLWAASANDIWAVGDSFVDQRNPTLFEHWDGTSWSVVIGEIPHHTRVWLLGVSGNATNNVYAVGAYRTCNACNGAHTFAEHWDGSSWTIVSSQNPTTIAGYPLDNYLDGVSVVVGGAFATGNETVQTG
jgi:hypothetical protein